MTTEDSADGLVVGVHWLRAVSFEPLDRVVEAVAAVLGESVEVREGGRHFYDTTHVVGPVQLWSHSSKVEQGVCLEVTGSACEALGPEGLGRLWSSSSWRASRLDLAVDNCPFTPAQVRDAWRAGDVNTRVKTLAEGEAAEGREGWRRSEWLETPTGDLFGMGSRSSSQYARVYDERGWTRFELELKAKTAAAAAPLVFAALAAPAPAEALGVLTLGLIQRFVTFVDRGADTNLGRCPELGWWAAFAQGIGRARLALARRVVRSAAEMLEWAKVQVAPTLAVIARAFGRGAVSELVTDGRLRWRGRHRMALQLSGAAHAGA